MGGSIHPRSGQRASSNAMKTYSDDTLNQIVRHFSVAEKDYGFNPLTDGFINDTFLVVDDGRPVYILQRVNHNVFKDIAGVMNNIKRALHYLDAPDYRKITLVATKKGKGYWKAEGQTSNGNSTDRHSAEKPLAYWRMLTYIDQSTAHNTTDEPEVAYEAGRIIGKFHQLLAHADAKDFVDTIPRFHDLKLREAQFKSALAAAEAIGKSEGDNKKASGNNEGNWSDEKTKDGKIIAKTAEADDKGTKSSENKNSQRLAKAAGAISFAEDTLRLLNQIDFSGLPVRICHNDTKLNNILFSKGSGKALCLIDLDTLMKGHFIYDFGDAVRTIANTAPEDEQDHSKITFENRLFEAFVDGLSTNKAIFSSNEIDTMAWGAVLMPFLHGIRALTDYLNGDIYYKVTYENQNLDRCLSLFDFTEKALGIMEYMREVIQTKLT